MNSQPKINIVPVPANSASITVRQSPQHSAAELVRGRVQSGQRDFASCSPPSAQPGVFSALTPPVRQSAAPQDHPSPPSPPQAPEPDSSWPSPPVRLPRCYLRQCTQSPPMLTRCSKRDRSLLAIAFPQIIVADNLSKMKIVQIQRAPVYYM